MSFNPYEVLGVSSDASAKVIKAAYRSRSRDTHPDTGGDEEQFHKVKEAFDILSDPARRRRFDETGKTRVSSCTPQAIQDYLAGLMTVVITAKRPDGTRDDPTRENIRDKTVLSIAQARNEAKNNRFEVQRMIERTTRLLERFKPQAEFDPVGNALRVEKDKLQSQMDQMDDLMEMMDEAIKTLKTYEYEVGPGPEGQHSPGLTLRLQRISSGTTTLWNG